MSEAPDTDTPAAFERLAASYAAMNDETLVGYVAWSKNHDLSVYGPPFMEMLRRTMISISTFKAAADRSSRRMEFLTCAVGVLVIVQIAVAIWTAER